MESETVTTAASVASTSNVLYVINDLDPESSPGNMFLKHPMGLMNVQDLHLLATANLIAQTQETIAQQYNVSVDQEPEKQPANGSRSTKTKVKRSVLQSGSAEKPSKRCCFSDQRIRDTATVKDTSSKSKSKQELEPATYFCTHCKEKFNTDAELKTHYKLHNTMECSHLGCNRKFTWPAHFKYHQLTHGGDKKFSCEVDGCGRLFYTAQHLEVHQRTHTNTKPFSCLDCRKTFTTAGNLRNHMRCHTGEKPFACDYPDCDKRFAELSTLKKHKITHTGQKPFQCDVCGKTFTQSSSRRTHMKSHLVGKQTKGDNSLGDTKEVIHITKVLKGDNTNATTDTDTCRPSEEANIKEEEQVVSEDAIEAHINETITNTGSTISIVVLSPDDGNQNNAELSHVTEQVTNPDGDD